MCVEEDEEGSVELIGHSSQLKDCSWHISLGNNVFMETRYLVLFLFWIENKQWHERTPPKIKNIVMYSWYPNFANSYHKSPDALHSGVKGMKEERWNVIYYNKKTHPGQHHKKCTN